ncbi:MAG: TetR/AcrR family transcriptional regulator [Oscillatoriophycideae cyanobacterium NC_groundwater_1537_Pr4_S-0.65um_50_18]|nr:TetR/AcrR family transcriptional regulator [Oscillatoriophycideae cyanobacterium NC_groundwater_1537_Pr4_S-0.65um_50_18]
MTHPKPGKEKTRDRLIEAAIEVFATAGIVGATTREIARVAGVNEVTLFRHFQNKEQLLGAVVQQVTALQSETLANQDEWTQDLRQDLLHYAWVYTNMLETHEALVRMFIGEAKRHPEEAVKVLQQSFLPLRDKLTNYLQKGIERGTVQPDADLLLSVDLFTGMLLAGVLRRHTAPAQRGYSRDRYVEGCVDLLIRGLCPDIAPVNPQRL